MQGLIEILKNSSLSTTMSTLEIEEIVQEISGDFEDFLEDERLKISDSLDDDMQRSFDEISDLKKEIEILKRRNFFPENSLKDVMAQKWVLNNWEFIVKIDELNMTGQEAFDAIKQKINLKHIEELFISQNV